MLLVTVRHQIERELVFFAAQATNADAKLDDAEYHNLIQKEREKTKKEEGWKNLYAKLGLDTKTQDWLETLRLLSNLYKHDIWSSPNKTILDHLSLDPGKNYMAVHESHAFIDGLAKSLELSSGADYSDIAEAFVDRSSGLFSSLRAKLGVRYYRASLDNFGV